MVARLLPFPNLFASPSPRAHPTTYAGGELSFIFCPDANVSGTLSVRKLMSPSPRLIRYLGAVIDTSEKNRISSSISSISKILRGLLAATFAMLLIGGRPASAQNAAAVLPVTAPLMADSSSELPDDPEPQIKDAPDATQSEPDPHSASENAQAMQTKRILGIIPNFRAVSSTDVLPPQTVKEKFLTATDDSFDYSSIFIPSALAGYGMATRAYPEFGDGAEAYGQYLWRAGVDQTIENYMVEFVVPAIARQDTRYYTLGHGGFFKRTGYALSRSVVTRSDHAREEFNVSEVFGAGASAAISTAYYPASSRTFGNVGTAWAIDVGIDAASMVAKEFWPDINKRLFHTKSVPTQ
jgi:hypothetical protein